MSKKNDSNDKTAEAELIDALSKQSLSQEKIIVLLQELAKWVKVTSHPQVGKILSEQVQSSAQKIVFKNSDGKKTTKELSELSGTDPADISRDWKQWTRAGITEQVPAQGGSRGRSLFSLEEFGIEVPKSKLDKMVNEEKLKKVKKLSEIDQAKTNLKVNED